MLPSRRASGWLAACLLIAACQRETEPPPAQAPRVPDASAAAAAARPEKQSRPQIVVLGDSLTAGLGLSQDQAYPALLQQKLADAGYEWEVVNAGVSGDTSAGGLARVDWALDQGPVRILILELGANDGLRGLPPEEMKKNLAAIVERAQARRIEVLLAGMEAPPNFGPDYTVSFRQVYRDLAQQYRISLLPFLLGRVAGVPSLNQGDGIHPNPAGERIVAENVWAALKPLVDAAGPK